MPLKRRLEPRPATSNRRWIKRTRFERCRTMIKSGTNVLNAARLHVSFLKGDGLNSHNSAAQNVPAASIDESETIRVSNMQTTKIRNAAAVEIGPRAKATPRAVATPLPPRNLMKVLSCIQKRPGYFPYHSKDYRWR